ncbi:MAG TPA: glycosyltransferase family 4 protein [Anaerohalosphaeraceae bacterium]|nr:glycosyltransferase family 4 protein [Anaerohalosphaeraceae bacterium]HRT49987.1 glycosyltransferase family 4 protein [Anaerohalosphaeraceae bacterium]HRT85715.1 glycosyltransferase family 4 protein [Anaerohalosphaeraceae bacterium]
MKKRLVHVCFVSPKAYPLFDPKCKAVFGGAEVDLYNLGVELAKDASFEVSFVTADYGQPAAVRLQNIQLIRSLSFREGPLAGAWKVWKALKKANADIYVIKTASPAVPLLESFCTLHKKVFVYRSAHQDDCDGTYARRHRLAGMAYARAVKRAHAVLTQNQTDRDNLQKWLAVEASVIPNGHHLPPPDRNPRTTILWVGRSAEFKHPERFIELARCVPSERFTMICQRATGDTAYTRLVAQARAVSNLTFIEQVPHHEIDVYFRVARVLVNTSDSEGFSNAFIEACKWSVPILSLSVNPDNFLTRWSCGLCCGGDQQRLVEGLRFLLENDRYQELGRNARKYAQANHDITQIVEQYKELFRKLAE